MSEMLRPWYFAGVSHFWPDPEAPELDEDTAAMLRSGTPARPSGNFCAPPASARPGAAPSPPWTVPPSSASSARAASPSIHPEGPSPSRVGEISGIAGPSGVNGPAPAAANPRGSAAPGEDVARRAAATQKSVHHPTPARQALLGRTPAAPVLWTYPELGADLTGGGDPQRSACLRGLIASLRLPKGTNCFWPLRLPEEEAAEAAEQFLVGLEILRPNAVILFGDEAQALCGAFLTPSAPFTHGLHGGRLYLLLPEMARLIVDPGLAATAAAFLFAQFSGLPGVVAV